MRLVYVVGPPASGKTTLVEETAGALLAEHTIPFAWREHAHASLLGAHRPPFSGTDTLSMNVSPRALAWLDQQRAEVPWPVLAEGDRLAHLGFLGGLADAGIDVRLVELTCPATVLMTRREDRAAQVGKAQNASWLRGRETKVANLIAAWTQTGRPLDRLNSADLLSDNASALRRLLAA